MNPANETILSATARVATDVVSFKFTEPSSSGATIMGVILGLVGGMMIEGKTQFVGRKFYKNY